MARLNQKTQSIQTHEGGTAQRINSELELRRSVMSCMLWENDFYEDGKKIADRIQTLVAKTSEEKVKSIAIEARNKMKLRHVPLLIACAMTKNKMKISDLLYEIIQRPDELTEFLAIYWRNGKTPISAQAKLGLAKSFTKFDEYSLSKYNRDNAIKLKDVLFMVHAKPLNLDQESLWKRLISNELFIPDTWETELSAGKDKKTTWERLITENKLGGLAVLRNLRNMQESKVDDLLIRQAINQMKSEKVLPFRFIAASRYAPQYENLLENKLFECTKEMNKLTGKTVVLVDVSGSMDSEISSKSDLKRIDAACGVAIICRELSENIQVFSFSDKIVEVPVRRGFALRDAIVNSQQHSNTYLGQAVDFINKNIEYDRLIVFSDEQTADKVPNPKGKAYMINVASNQNGIGYNQWVHIDGFSEAVISYIIEYENVDN